MNIKIAPSRNPFSFLILLPILFFSCKKSDFNIEKSENLIEKRFFELPINASIPLKQLVEKIKDDNKKKNFLNAFIKKNGYPLWAQSFSNVSLINEGAGKNNASLTPNELAPAAYDKDDPSSVVCFIIPFQKENSNEITSYLKYLKKGDSIYMRTVNKEEYIKLAKQEFDKIKLKKHLEDLFLFSYFEKR